MLIWTLMELAAGLLAIGTVGIALYVAVQIAHFWVLGILSAEPKQKPAKPKRRSIFHRKVRQ